MTCGNKLFAVILRIPTRGGLPLSGFLTRGKQKWDRGNDGENINKEEATSVGYGQEE